MRDPINRIPTLRLAAATALWIVVVGLGLGAAIRFSNTPGRLSESPSIWPDDAAIARSSSQTLVLFVHPQCSCSSASLGELARLVARFPDGFEPIVSVYEPASPPAHWNSKSMWAEARRIPGARLYVDRDGTQARLFHATTSGQALLYDRSGVLTFAGGLTASRGHWGDNDGTDAVASILRDNEPRLRRTPVFGCGLLGN